MSATIIIPTPQKFKVLFPTTSPSGSSGSLAIGIPANNCEIIELIASIRSAHAAAIDNVTVRFNGDSGANYNRENYIASAAAINAAVATPTTGAGTPNCASDFLAANIHSQLVVRLFNNKSGSFKIFEVTSSLYSSSGPTAEMSQFRGTYNSTNEITAINLVLALGNFKTSTRFQVIGYDVSS